MARIKPQHSLMLLITVATFTVSLLIWRHALTDNVKTVFEPAPTPKELEQNPLRFTEVSKSLGISHRHTLYFPHPFTNNSQRAKYLVSIFPAVSVADVNNDGYMDIYLPETNLHGKNHLYINQNGKNFVERGSEFGIAHINDKFPSSQPLLVDLNHDGRIDLLQTRFGCHDLYLGTAKGHFQRASAMLSGYCSNPNAVNVIDFNQDGRLDLVFGNLYPNVDLRKEFPPSWVLGTRNDKTHGGKNNILLAGNQGFADSGIELKYKSFTHSAGVADINDDGFPDLFFANDYSADELFINKNGKEVVEVTEEYIPTFHHGRSGMNAEFFDFNQDGLLDLYVTNAYKPPYVTGYNLLWEKQESGKYSVRSKDVNVARCGFSWAAKAADFDLDGKSDLFVVNGRVSGPEVDDPNEANSYWYKRILAAHVPLPLRRFMSQKDSFSDWHLSGNEPSCLFHQTDDGFRDVAVPSGIADSLNGRGMALVDFDNDGLKDLIITNWDAPTLLYHNRSERRGNWLGIDLDGGRGWRVPYGAIAKLHVQGKKLQARLVYPTNGFRGQSDPRLVFGLGDASSVEKLQVMWPDGKIEVFTDLRLNLYQTLRKGDGKFVSFLK